jgi:hypothetical protein
VDSVEGDARRSFVHRHAPGDDIEVLPDAIDDPFKGGVDELIAWIRNRHMTKQVSLSLHSISNMLIEFAGPDTAVVESSLLDLEHQLGAGKVGVVEKLKIFARYVGRFERRGGEWRVQHRTVVLDSMDRHERPATPAAAQDGPRGVRST